MLHLMRQALADTAATGQDDRPAAGGDVDMVDQGAAAPDPQVPTGVSLSKAQNEFLAKMTGERKRQLLQIKTADEMGKMQPPLKKACLEAALLLRGHKPAQNSRSMTADVGVLKKQLRELLEQTEEPQGPVVNVVSSTKDADASASPLEEMARQLDKNPCTGTMFQVLRSCFCDKVWELPKSAESLKKILKDLDEHEKAAEQDRAPDWTLHRVVALIANIDTDVKKGAYVSVLRAELKTKLDQLREKAKEEAQSKKAEKQGKAKAEHPVLSRLGSDGKLRVLWEHYKLYDPFKPRVMFSLEHDSYITRLHGELCGVLNDDETKLPEMRYVRFHSAP